MPSFSVRFHVFEINFNTFLHVFEIKFHANLHVFEIIGERAEIYITEIQQTITYSQSKEATDHSAASFLGFYYEII